MFRNILSGLLVFILLPAGAQSVQWATEVLEFSSELTPVQYSAKEALGKPNVLPVGGESPNAWSPNRPNRREYIKLGYERAVNIRQIAIAESLNPSALFRISVFDPQGNEHEVATLNPQSIPLKGRMLNVFIEQTPYLVSAIKLEFDGAAVPGYFALDAVAISDSDIPIIADIPQPVLLASGIVIERLDESVNSTANELNPLLSPDGKTLYFSRSNHPENMGGVNDKEDIWYSEIDSAGHWQIARNMGPQFNTEQPNFVSTITSITPDGKSAIMVLGNEYKENGKVVAGVSMSSLVNGQWSRPVALKIENGYNMNEKANYFLADNRKTLIMSVERMDTHGDRDLYVSFMGSDSVWSEPLNLGDVVNSAAEESAPFLASDNVTLYFSSNGFSGYGGNDIYVTRRLDDTWTRWSEPENLGPEINSTQEDLFFNIPAQSEYAYYSRGVDENNIDIFRVKLPIVRSPEPWVAVRGNLVDAKTGEPIIAKIVYERLPDGVEIGVAQVNPQDGTFEFRLPAGHLYGIRAEAENHISENQNLDLRGITDENVVMNRNFTLDPIQVAQIADNTTITLNNIFFDFDKAELKQESFAELNRIATLMSERPSMKVEITGHTCDIGTEAYNLDLSQRRATSVQRYLAGKGIDEGRIEVSYYGESRPEVPNTSLENRRKNRRVEFTIKSLTP